jgi:hypothetical protein
MSELTYPVMRDIQDQLANIRAAKVIPNMRSQLMNPQHMARTTVAKEAERFGISEDDVRTIMTGGWPPTAGDKP